MRVGLTLVSGDWICKIVYITHVLDDAFETGDLVGKTEVVKEAGIKRVDIISAGIGVVESTMVVEDVESR
jgi:putative intracellular protease/amidase